MSTMAAALGMEGIFCVGDLPRGSTHEIARGGNRNATELVSVGGIKDPRSAWESGVAIQGVLSRRAATEFYRSFLVPRLLETTESGGGSGLGEEASAASFVVLKSLSERFLLARAGECTDSTKAPWERKCCFCFRGRCVGRSVGCSAGLCWAV